MIIVVGAGGHALELLDVLKEEAVNEELFFFDSINTTVNNFKGFKILHSTEQITALSDSFEFVLAVGNTSLRKKFYQDFSAIGGKIKSIQSKSSFISSHSMIDAADIMKNCFIGPDAQIKKGSLINTGAQVHHQVVINEFSEISPRAVVLGKAVIGSSCTVGANATILPNIKIGNNVVVAAGAVVTKDLSDNCMAAGVPAEIKKQF